LFSPDRLLVVRSPLAKRDIVDVIAFTKRRWGSEQARAYGALITEALNALTSNAGLGVLRDDIRPGLRAYHIRQSGRPARHILFYVVADGGIVRIVRLLHEAMDFTQHLT
jgi:toxin ParE1/3/4